MRESKRRTLQAIAFGLIMLPPVGLYFAASSGWQAGSAAFMLLIAAGMLLAIWAS